MASHNDLGKKGEELGVAFLKEKGYQILAINFRYRKAEIDIIARKEDVLIAVEVKTRSSAYFGNPQDFISPKKIHLLVSALDQYILERELEVEVRFDVIAILFQKNKTEITHLEDAFLYF